MSDGGIPATWRHMNGYSSHTFIWYNAGGQKFWVKYHVKTDQGIATLTDSNAKVIATEDPDAHMAAQRPFPRHRTTPSPRDASNATSHQTPNAAGTWTLGA
jgi:hypothetical protein